MADPKKNRNPFGTSAIILLLVTFFVGVYLLSETVNTRFEEHELLVEGKLEMLQRGIDNLEQTLIHQRGKNEPTSGDDSESPGSGDSVLTKN